MTDTLKLRWRGPRPAHVDGFVNIQGCLVLPGTSFKRDDLVAIAAANGFRLTPALLHKWTNWRLVTGPTPGGPTGRGRGKGQRWARVSAVQVAWISRWHADSLTYDVLRVVMWPWKPALERDRIDQLRASLLRFVAQDRSFHMRNYVIDRGDPLESAIEAGTSEGSYDRAYLNTVLIGDPDDEEREQLLAPARAAGASDAALEKARAFLDHLNLLELEDSMRRATDDDLRNFITEYRANGQSWIQDSLWTHPLLVARDVVTQLHRYMLDR